MNTIFRLIQNLQADGVLWNIGCSFSCTFRCLFYTGIDSLFVYRMVPEFPTLIVSGFAAIAAIQSFFAGLVLQTMLQKNHQDFEMVLVQNENHYKELLQAAAHSEN